jgi:cold shock CspA family protein
VLLAERVIGYGAIEDRGDAEAHLGMIKETEWFKQGDSETTIKLGISKLRTAWYELPPKFRDANDLTDLLLKAIPSTVPWDTERTYSQRLAHEMDEHEALGMGRKWSFAQLKKMITKRLRAPRPGSNGAPPAPSHTALVAHRPTTPTATPTATETAHMRPADGKDDVFCHKSAIEGDEPQEGEKVQFKIKHQLKQGKSRERADEVKRAPPSATAMVATHTETDEDEHVGLAF